jgi:hypothetical protein
VVLLLKELKLDLKSNHDSWHMLLLCNTLLELFIVNLGSKYFLFLNGRIQSQFLYLITRNFTN